MSNLSSDDTANILIKEDYQDGALRIALTHLTGICINSK